MVLMKKGARKGKIAIILVQTKSILDSVVVLMEIHLLKGRINKVALNARRRYHNSIINSNIKAIGFIVLFIKIEVSSFHLKSNVLIFFRSICVMVVKKQNLVVVLI